MKLNLLQSNNFLAEQRRKNEIKRLLSKYKHRNDIYEHRKQKNKSANQICSQLATEIRFRTFQ